MTDMYSKSEKIGEGYTSTVYLGNDIVKKQNVAIKTYKDTIFVIINSNHGTKTEIDLLSRTKHPNIIRLDDIYVENSTINTIFELSNMNFDTLLRDIKLSEEERNLFIYQFLSSIRFLHKNEYLHLDIKPENILYSDQSLKLCDFGQSRHFHDIEYNDGHVFVSSVAYRAPEYSTRNSYFKDVAYGRSCYKYDKTFTLENVICAEFFSIGRLILDIYSNDSGCEIKRYKQIIEMTLSPFQERIDWIHSKSNYPDCKLTVLINLLLNHESNERLTDFDEIFSLLPDKYQEPINGHISLELPNHTFYSISQYNPIRYCFKISKELSMTVYELGSIFGLYYKLLPFGLNYFNNIIRGTDVYYIIMLTSIKLGSNIDDDVHPVYSYFTVYTKHETYKKFLLDSYLHLKGITKYDNITNYSKKYGNDMSWLSLRYYLKHNINNTSFKEYLEQINLDKRYKDVSERIDMIPITLYNKIFE